jgi:hypothetical protein
MRIFTLATVGILAAVVSVPASAANEPTGSPRVTSLRCKQFAMVREHHHSPIGWPKGCRSKVRPPLKPK